jgi:hypothetical protein
VEFPDLRITAMEVTQGIQNLANDMPLVAGRRTTVRVYVDVIGEEFWEQVDGVLEARRNGISQGMILADNGPIIAHDDGGNRLNVDDTLNFDLPAGWTSGEVELRALVWSFGPETIYDEPTAINNLTFADFVFHEGTDITVHPVALHTHRAGDPEDVERTFWGDLFGIAAENGGGLEGYDSGDAIDSLNGLYRYHPVAHVEVDPFPAELHPTGHADGVEWQFLGCFTTITAVSGPDAPGVAAGLRVADWEVFFEDPSSMDPQAFTSPQTTVPDRDKVIVAERVFEISSLSIDPDTGEAVLSGTYDPDNFFGSLPDVGRRAHPSGCPGDGLNNSAPNVQMALWRVAYDNWAPAGEFFYGMLHPLLRSSPGGLASADDSAWGRMFTAYGEEWRHGGAWLAGHEIGHLAGLPHVGCGVDVGIDLNHPVETYPTCALAPTSDEGFMGFDVYHDLWPVDSPMVFSNDPGAPEANRAFPFMSYARPGYPDPYHWCVMLNYYGVSCDPAELPLVVQGAINGPRDLQLPAPLPIDGLDLDTLPVALIAGQIDSELGLATFAPQAAHGDITLERGLTSNPDLWRFPGAAGQPTVRVSQGGNIVYETPVTIGVSDVAGPGAAFTAAVPVHPGLTVEIVSPDGTVLGTETIGPNRLEDLMPDASAATTTTSSTSTVPTEIVALDLQGSDLPLDSIVQAEYSPDGHRWYPVGEAATTLPIQIGRQQLAALPGSDAGEVRLAVRDGWHVVHVSVGQVAVDPKPPTITIAAEGSGILQPLGSRVRLEAGAADLEDGSLSDLIQWTSSLDGPFGAGPLLDTTELSAGQHTITAVAVDSSGDVASASVVVTIDAATARPHLGEEAMATVAGLITSLAATGELPDQPAVGGGAAVPATTSPVAGEVAPAGTPAAGGSPIGWILLLLALASAAGAGVALRNRTR